VTKKVIDVVIKIIKWGKLLKIDELNRLWGKRDGR